MEDHAGIKNAQKFKRTRKGKRQRKRLRLLQEAKCLSNIANNLGAQYTPSVVPLLTNQPTFAASTLSYTNYEDPVDKTNDKTTDLSQVLFKRNTFSQPPQDTNINTGIYYNKRDQQKYSVISLCQKAIDLLDLKYKFCLKKSQRGPKKKNQSPIHQNLVKFNFTTPSEIAAEDIYPRVLNELLVKIGVLNSTTKDIDELIDSVADLLLTGQGVTKETVGNILKISLLDSIKHDSSTCLQKTTKNAETQCKEYCSVGTQSNNQ